jgi:hypothetical protein
MSCGVATSRGIGPSEKRGTDSGRCRSADGDELSAEHAALSPQHLGSEMRVTRSAAVSLVSPSSGLLASCSYSAMTCRLASRQNPIRAGNHLLGSKRDGGGCCPSPLRGIQNPVQASKVSCHGNRVVRNRGRYFYDAAHPSRSGLASNCFQWPMFVPMVRERAARNDPLPGHRPLPRLCVHRLAAFEIRMSDGVFSRAGGPLLHVFRDNSTHGSVGSSRRTRSGLPRTSLLYVRQIVEPQPFSIFQLKHDTGTDVSPPRSQALQLPGLNRNRDRA